MPKPVFLLLPLLSVVKACCLGCFRAVLIAGMSWLSFERSLNQSFGHFRPAVSRYVEAIRIIHIGYWLPWGIQSVRNRRACTLSCTTTVGVTSHFHSPAQDTNVRFKEHWKLFHEGFPRQHKKSFTWLLNMASLREYFQCEYHKGGLFNHQDSDFEFLEEEWVWHCKISGLRCGQMLGIFPVPSPWMMWSCRWGWFLVVAKLDAWFICMHSCWIIREYKLFLPCFIVFFDRQTHDKLLVCSHKRVNTGSTDTNLHLNTYHNNHFTKKSGHHL